MKLKSFTGGQASRAEVYGLFLASIVLVGGGIGGAYAITSTLNQKDPVLAAAVSTETPTPSDSVPPVSTEAPAPTSDSSTPSDVNTGTNGGSGTVPNQPIAPPPFVDTRIQAPYIGPANTFSYLSRNYICGWDTAAMGGFGWGFDPAEPCNEEYVAYVGQHCEAGDGVIFNQRCEEYFAHRLPVDY